MSSFQIPEGYRAHRNHLLHAVIDFTLDGLYWEKIPIKDPEDIIKVYEADLGINKGYFPRLLKGRVSTSRLIELHDRYRDSILVDLFPVPEHDDKKYITFLNTCAADSSLEIFDKFKMLKLLFQFDRKTYTGKYRDFIIENVDTGVEWVNRRTIYGVLFKIGDEKSIKKLNQALLSDPISQCRGWIMEGIEDHKLLNKFIDSILDIEGKSKPHDLAPVMSMCLTGMMSLNSETIRMSDLEDYLRLDYINDSTRGKIQAELDKLRKIRAARLRKSGLEFYTPEMVARNLAASLVEISREYPELTGFDAEKAVQGRNLYYSYNFSRPTTKRGIRPEDFGKNGCFITFRVWVYAFSDPEKCLAAAMEVPSFRLHNLCYNVTVRVKTGPDASDGFVKEVRALLQKHGDMLKAIDKFEGKK
ncbi:MAG: hypothetical protein E3J72_04740 [Planctomycetota bacterium]|nr:MAG: hypothetical protein E3J72_04740 [Planctomycetota bacterium]